MEPAHLRAVQQGREDPSDRHLSGLLLGSGRSPQGALEALIRGRLSGLVQGATGPPARLLGRLQAFHDPPPQRVRAVLPYLRRAGGL